MLYLKNIKYINNWDLVDLSCYKTIGDFCFKNKKEAKKIAIEAHETGKAICYQGSIEECETIAEKLGAERLTVSIDG